MTEGLAVELDGYICTNHADMEGGVQTTGDNDDELVVAGLETFAADEITDTDVTIAVEDTGGFPGEHVAHLIPAEELSQDYTPGDTGSDETAGAVVVDDAATVFEAELTFEDMAVEEELTEGESVATVDASLSDGAGGDTPYVVDIHPTNAEGELVGSEFIGATNVLSGSVEDASVIGERFPEDGEFNEFPIAETDDYVAMIHIVTDEDTSLGDSASPGTFPVLPNADATGGIVPGGVTDDGRIFNQVPSATITLNNIDNTAWQVIAIDGEGATAPTGENNPTLELETGTRYGIENDGWDNHPLAFRDDEGTVLLSQSSEGTLEDDQRINWRDDGDTVAFTLTRELANTVDEYYCTNHSSMAGDVLLERTLADYTNEDDIVTDELVFQAVQDWQDNRISNQLVLEVVQAWQSGEPI